MEQAASDPWIITLVSVNLLGSIAAWIWILWRWRTSGEVVPYEPRRAAPWGPGATLPALLLTLTTILFAFAPAAAEPGIDIRDGQEIAWRLSRMLLWHLLLYGGSFFLIALIYRATVHDFGLPKSGREALGDVGMGIVTCFAAFLPVGVAQKLLQRLMGRENDLSQHQLIQMLVGADAIDSWVMLLAGVSTVVVAPFCEELAFRLLFQGSLEKWEDEIVRIDSAGPDEPTTQAWRTALEGSTEPLVMNGPAGQGVAGIPYGWLPILASSVLFGLAHAGYGPEPVPLFVFGILLGYVFQRTNRILPSIIAHGLFNLMTMLALWRIVAHGTE